MEKRLSIVLGVMIGGMWIGEVLLGNLGGTSVFGNLRDFHPQIYALARWFALGAVGVTLVGGLVSAYRTGSIVTALHLGFHFFHNSCDNPSEFMRQIAVRHHKFAGPWYAEPLASHGSGKAGRGEQ